MGENNSLYTRKKISYNKKKIHMLLFYRIKYTILECIFFLTFNLFLTLISSHIYIYKFSRMNVRTKKSVDSASYILAK